jgi:hypothetical protein
MRRRQFITLLAGAAIAPQRLAAAQTPGKIFRPGSLSPIAGDPAAAWLLRLT